MSFDRPASTLLVLTLFAAGPAAAAADRDAFEVKRAVAHDVSAPLTLVRPAPDGPVADHEPRAVRAWKDRLLPVPPDAVLQASTPPLLAPAPVNSFAGIGDTFPNKDGSIFRIGGFPPDTDGDVGPKHYVQIVNASFAVFDKATGKPMYGSVPTNTIWSGFGGACETHRDGDGVVLYDPLADRWLITQFAVVQTGPWFQCVAVSATGDPTGQYYRYAYQYDGFNDYGKFGVWPDAYYATYNSFNGSGVFRGAVVCAFDRTSMLQGLPASEQCFKLFQTSGGPPLPDGSNLLYGNILPADLDGQNPPPAGAPNDLMSFDSQTNLQLWRFHVDWLNPANTTLTGSGACDATSCPPVNVAVQPYTPLCYEPGTPGPDGGSILPDGGPPTNGTCVPQSGGALPLDSLADRPMFRLAYRNFGDHESLLLNHSVRAGNGGGGVRWYELRDPNGPAPVLYQQGTFAPDADYRWMGSMAMDSAGNIALGYSRSGNFIDPGISFTARTPSDPPGVMGQGEGQITPGGGPQSVPSQPKGAVRWGDYTSLGIDPADDCTFWYTNEYIPGFGAYWHTTVASFQLPSCQSFSETLSPASGVLERGGAPLSVTVTVSGGSGPADLFDLSVPNPPPGVTVSLSSTSVLPGQGSVLTLVAQPGTATLRAAPVAVAATRRANNQPHYRVLTLDVLGNEFALGVSPAAVVLSAGTGKQVTVQTAVVHGAPDTIALSVAAPLPPGVSAVFNPASVQAGGTSVLSLATVPGVGAQASSLALRGTSTNSTHVVGLSQTTLTLPVPSIDTPAANARLLGLQDFTLSAFISAGTSLARLELLDDGKLIASSDTSPATLHVDTTQLDNGLHQFTARATDANGGVGLSTAVALTINNPSSCGCSGAGGGVDAGGLCVALAFVLSRLARARPARPAR